MDDHAMRTALNVLKRTGVDADPVGDRIAIRPEDLLWFIAGAKAVRDRVELAKFETGLETGLLTNCAAFHVSWSYAESADAFATAKVILRMRDALRQSDAVYRRTRNEIIAICNDIAVAEEADQIAQRLHSLTPAHGRVGYAFAPHPVRITEILRSAANAHAAASAIDPAAGVARAAPVAA